MGRDSQVQTFFARRLRARREQLGWSQAELAKALSGSGLTLHGSAIAKIEAGDRAVRIDEAVAIASALDVDLDDLLPAVQDERALLRRYRRVANDTMTSLRESAMQMVRAYLHILDLLERNPTLYAYLRDENEDFSPTSADEYLSWVENRMKRVFRLPEDDQRVVVEDPHLIERLQSLISATVAGVVSDVPFPEPEDTSDSPHDHVVVEELADEDA